MSRREGGGKGGAGSSRRGGGSSGSAAAAASAPRSGDWTCMECANVNFARRTECHRCGEPRSAGGGNSGNGAARPSAPRRNGGGASSQSGGGGSSDKEPHRRHFDGLMKSDNPSLKTRADAEKFLRACIDFADVEELLSRLVSKRENGEKLLADALTAHDSFASRGFLNGSVMPLLKRLSGDALTRGMHKSSLDTLLCSLFELEQWMEMMYAALRAGELEQPEVFAWMLLQVVGIPDERGAEARKDKTVAKITTLLAMKGDACANIARQIQTVCAGTQVRGAAASASATRSLSGLLAATPGGRFDNDKSSYRDVRIVPTAEELKCDTPYLPMAPSAASVETEASTLERNFRLLREDFVAPLREELKLRNSRRVFERARVIHYFTGKPHWEEAEKKQKEEENQTRQPAAAASSNFKRASSRMIDRGHLQVTFAHSNPALQRKRDWWENNRRALGFQSLVCFVVRGEPFCFGDVCERDEARLCRPHEPIIGIHPCSSDDARKALKLQLQHVEFTLVQVDASFFACEPVMKALKAMTQVPFAEELVQWRPALGVRPPAHTSERYNELLARLEAGEPASKLIPSKMDNFKLDDSQEKAVHLCLKQRVGLVQGPPGTGKSFVGAYLAKALFEFTNEHIICVCYTNHALDDFLLHLLKHGIPVDQMVRIGGGDKVDARLDSVRLRDLAKTRSSQGRNNSMHTVSSSIERLQDEIEEVQQQMRRSRNLLVYIERKQPDWKRRFNVIAKGKDDMQLVGKKQKGKKGAAAVDKYYLLNRWQHNASAEEPTVKELLQRNGCYSSEADRKAWSMTREERKAQEDEWREDQMGELLDEYVSLTQELERAQALRKALQREADRDVLQTHRIIGVTTTGAAIHRDLLESVCAGVLMVEEAGEILESHVLTALSSNPKHMILIGDHQQLRPKVSHYPLQVESHKGHDLNRSLFERLARSDYPLTTLHQQHRMHPEISRFAREITYPQLRDADSLNDATRPPPRGLQRRVLFLDHRVLEDSSQFRQANDDGANSKVNTWEIRMLLRTLVYLLQQGYSEDKLVILTPYLGQLHAIREQLKTMRNLSAQLSELDENDLRQAEDKQARQKQANGAPDNAGPAKAAGSGGAAPAAAAAAAAPAAASAAASSSSAPAAGSGSTSTNGTGTPAGVAQQATIRLATIDNYQGEENDIVLISLVRSNLQKEIGFLNEPERVNVMLSRARCSMLLIGNSDTFVHSSKLKGKRLWSQIMQILHAQNAVVTGLPVVCQNHPSEHALLQQPEDFDQFVPSGGCRQPCQQQMSCGRHSCERRCHPDPKLHDNCRVKMTAYCPQKHPIYYTCDQTGTAAETQCKRCTQIEAARKEAERRAAEEAQKRAEAMAAEQARVAKLQAESAELDAQIAAAEQSKARELEALRLSIEVEHKLQVLRITQQADEQLAKEQETQLRLSGLARLRQQEKAHDDRLQLLRQQNEQKQHDILAPPGRRMGSQEAQPAGSAAAAYSDSSISGVDSLSGPSSAVVQRSFSGAQVLAAAAHTAAPASSHPVSASSSTPPAAAAAASAPGRSTDASCFVRGSDGFLQCSLCKTGVRDTGNSKKAHLLSNAHQARLTSSNSNLKAASSVAAPGLVAANGTHGRLPVSASAAAVSALPLGIEQLDEHWLRCVPCDVKINSLKQAQIHADTKKHKEWEKKQQQAENGTAAPSNGTGASAAKARPAAPGPVATAPTAVPPPVVVQSAASLKTGVAHLSAGRLLDAVKFFSPRVAANGPPNDATFLLALATALLDRAQGTAATEQLTALEPRLKMSQSGVRQAVSSYVLALLHEAAVGESAVLDDPEPDEEQLRRNVHVDLADSFIRHFKQLPSDAQTELAPGWPGRIGELEAAVAQHRVPPPPKPLSASEVVKQEWEYERDILNGRSAALNSLMDLTGLAKVKREILSMFHQAKLDRERKMDPRKTRRHALLVGNPGTGKTTVARLYCKFLIEIGALVPSSLVQETSGTKLAEDGVDGLKKALAAIEQAGGGVLFVDEAYQLDPKTNFKGSGVLNLLLTEMENRVGQLVVLFAGYDAELQKLMEVNPGLPSRFPFRFVFEDYDDAELLTIARSYLASKAPSAAQAFHVDGGDGGKYMRVLIRRIGRGRGRAGFGNARTVQLAIDALLQRQSQRLVAERQSQPDKFLLTREDVIGVRPSKERLQQCPAWRELQSMTGLSSVKAALLSITRVLEQNYDLELRGKEPMELSLNRVFLGNPGTGKTTVAKLYGAILKHLGMLSKGDLIEKSTSDFIGSAIGQSENQTRAILAQSAGCVLMIDEAYGLNPKRGGASGSNGGGECPYRAGAVNTIVEQVHNKPGEDRCVLMLGYREPMEALFNDSNPGLKRRMGWSDPIVFEDFSADELITIFHAALRKKSLRAEPACTMAVSDVLERAKRQPNFGNAGSVHELITTALQKRALRLNQMPEAERLLEERSGVLREADVLASQPKRQSLDAIFQSLIGNDELKTQVRRLQATIEMAQRKGAADAFTDVPFNFLFLGPPGTGKTTVARLMGQLFMSLGLLSSAEVLERSPSDLSTGYVGGAGPATTKVLREAMGKVLLIDEAYQLAGGSHGYGAQSADELVKALTSAEFKGKLVVILAGYEGDMRRMLSVNTGLSSRFPTEFLFRPLSAEHCWQILRQQLLNKDLLIPEELTQDPTSQQLLEALTRTVDWGNGRDVETLASRCVQEWSVEEHGRQQTQLLDGPVALEPRLLHEQMRKMLLEKQQRAQAADVSLGSARSRREGSGGPVQFATAHASAPPVQTSTAIATSSVATPSAASAAAVEEKQEEEEESDEKDVPPPPPVVQADGRDAGVSDAVWSQLQRDRAAQEAREAEQEAELQRLREEEEEALFVQQMAEEEAAEAARKAQAEADERRRQFLLRQQAEREAALKREREAAERARAAREAAERERQLEVKRRAAITRLGVCVAGFAWIKQAGGYRCTAGGHWVSDEEIENEMRRRG